MENQNLFNNISKNQIPSSFRKGPNFDPPFETLLFSMNENEWKKKKPPRILLIKGKSLNPSTGEIEIETDDETKPEIDYGLTEDYGSKMEGTWNLKHRFIIPALKEGVYHFRVKAVDRDGNEVETLDQSLEIEGLIPPLLKDLFEEEKEIKERVFEPNQRWASKGGSWLSKYGKLFPYFKEEIEKEELEKPRPKVKRREEISILTTGETGWKDYSVEFKVRADYNQSKFGIAVRYNEEDQSGYYLWIEQIKQRRAKLPLNYKITLEKKVRSKSEILQETIYTNNLKWFIIEMIVEGERIEVSVDGKKMIALKDSEIGRGKVAIFSEQSLPLTVIDDFIVKALSKKGVFGKNINGIQFIAENSNSSPSQSIVYSLMSSISASSFSRPSRLSRPSTEKGPNEGRYPDSLELNELNEPLNSSTPALTNSSTPEPLNSSIPEPSPDPIYQTTSSLPVNEVVYYYHHDHLGNIRAVTDQNGNVVERHDLYPFGEEITQPTNKDSYLFTGKPRDSESGLDYFGARYYSSSLSRFMSVDPAPGFIADTRTLNPYIYAANNPLVYIDRDGEVVVIAAVAIGAGIAGLINGTAEALTEYIANPNASFKDLAKSFGAGFAGGVAGGLVTAGLYALPTPMTKNPMVAGPPGQAVQSIVTNFVKTGEWDCSYLYEAGEEALLAIVPVKVIKTTKPRVPGRPIAELKIRKFKNWGEFLKWMGKPGTRLYMRQKGHENFISAFYFWMIRDYDRALWYLRIWKAMNKPPRPTVTVEWEYNWDEMLSYGRANPIPPSKRR
jgi:RHS repeat-associated protein